MSINRNQPDTTLPTPPTPVVPPKHFVGQITQTGTNDPTLQTVENTIGTITPSRNGVGTYQLDLPIALTLKTTTFVGTPVGNGVIYVHNDTGKGASTIFIDTLLMGGGGFASNDNLLNRTPITITINPE